MDGSQNLVDRQQASPAGLSLDNNCLTGTGEPYTMLEKLVMRKDDLEVQLIGIKARIDLLTTAIGTIRSHPELKDTIELVLKALYLT